MVNPASPASNCTHEVAVSIPSLCGKQNGQHGSKESIQEELKSGPKCGL